MNKASGRGRRVGSPDTREQVLAAARNHFLAQGYQSATLRGIADAAGVDVALISYYFGSKQQLFGAAMALPANPIEIVQGLLGGDRETLAITMLSSLLAVWDDDTTGPPLRAMATALPGDPALARVVVEAVNREIIDQLAKRIGGKGARQKAGAFATGMAGLIFARYVLFLEPIATMSAAEVVARMGPALRLTIAP